MHDNLQNIKVEQIESVLIVTLNRPEKRNILDLETRKELLATLKSHERNGAVRCVLLTATGDIFSAGADIKYLLSLNTKSKARNYANFVRGFLHYIEGYPKPTVAAVNGTAVGGGLELLMTLDIVVSSSEARFGQTELNVGLIPGGGGSQRLPRFVGLRKAKELIFTGEIVSADAALQLGLVNSVVPKESLMEEALKICKKIVSKSPLGLKLAKKSINASFERSLKLGLHLESSLYAKILTSKDGPEGMIAFLDKRSPVYS